MAKRGYVAAFCRPAERLGGFALYTYHLRCSILISLKACYTFPMFKKDELEEALRAIESMVGKCEKVMPKLKPGTSQHTLLLRRIKALEIASVLIKQELEDLDS